MAAQLDSRSPSPTAFRCSGSAATIATVALAVLGLSLVGLVHPLQNLNEGLYARIPEEMLASRDFVVPTLNGVPYLEKPPLLYWITALAYALFGVSEATARTGPVLGALLTFSAAAWFARRRLAPHSDAFTLAVLVGAPIVVVMGRTLLFDMLLTGCFSWALVTLACAMERESGPRPMRVSAVALALAVLTKGLAPLVFYGAIALVLVPARDPAVMRARLRTLFEPGAAALFFLVAAPWHVAAALREPGFSYFYFINEHVLRFLDRREPHDYHTGPWWYYLARLPAYLFPWSLLLLAPFAWRSDRGDARRFLLAWILVPLVLFSLSKAKASYYLLIGVPPLALLIGDALARLRDPRAALTLVAIGWLGLLAAASAVDEGLFAPYVLPRAHVPLIAVACGLAAAALVSALRRQPLIAAGLLGALALPGAFLLSQALQANEVQRSARLISNEVARSARPVYLFRDFEAASSLPWYLGRNIGVVEPRSADLWFGRRLRPDVGDYPDPAQFVARATTTPLWLVVDSHRRAEFDASPLAGELAPVARYGRLWLYASRPLMAELHPGNDRDVLAHKNSAAPR